MNEVKPERSNPYMSMSELPPRSLSYISERSSRPETRHDWAITQQFKHKHEVYSYSYCIINVLLLFFLFSQVSSSFFSRWLSFCISLQLILLYNIKDLCRWLLLLCFVAEQNHDAPPDRQTGCTRFGEEVSQGKRHKLHVITDHLSIYIVDKKNRY